MKTKIRHVLNLLWKKQWFRKVKRQLVGLAKLRTKFQIYIVHFIGCILYYGLLAKYDDMNQTYFKCNIQIE